MRMFVCFIIFGCGISYATNAYSQITVLSLNVRNKTVKEVFSEIEKNSEYIFFYYDGILDMERKVSLNLKNQKIDVILNKLFENSNNNYIISDRQITISRKPEPIPVPPPPQVEEQQQVITGTVTDAEGVPLPGTSIVIKGTHQGTVTDANGAYSLQVPNENVTLVFSFIGFATREFLVGNQTKIDVTLNLDTRKIEEVVVVGYGTMKKQNLTGSIVTINFNDAMESRPTTNLASALTGLTPGLNISQTSSAPGDENISLQVRGVSSWTNSEPLVLIDGVAGNIKDVNPNDVENVSILKDASSSSIYGSRASNGVILVTTKRGGVGNVTVNYNGYIGQQSAANMIDFIYDYPTHMELLNESAINAGQPAYYKQDLIEEWREMSKTDPINYPNTDWFNEMLQPSTITEHNLSIRGGSEKANFIMSLGFLDNKGIIDNAGFKKYSFRLNADSKVNDWLQVGGNVFGFWSDRAPVNVSEFFRNMLATNPGILPKTDERRYGGSLMEGEIISARNPRAFVDNSIGNHERQYVGTKFFARINFLKFFEFETNFAGSFNNMNDWAYTKPVNIWNTRSNTVNYVTIATNSLTKANNRSYNTLVNSLLRFNYSIDNAHHITALVGFDQEYSRMDNFSAGKSDFTSDVIYILDAGAAAPVATGTAQDWALRSYFGRINYNYKGKYLFEANARYDGSSRFDKEYRWGFFPSFSAGWRLSEEAFFESIRPVVNNLKMRVSWGQLGNNNLNSNYGYQATYANQNYSFGGDVASGMAATALPNKILTWETATVTDIGFDLAFFRNKLTFSVDIFDKNTSDQLMNADIPYVMGAVSAPWQNLGEINNKGIETQILYYGKIGKDFTYSVGGNMSMVENKVLKYKGELIQYRSGSTVQVVTEGHAFGRFWLREVDHIIQEQSEIDDLITQGFTFNLKPSPGDFLYKNNNAADGTPGSTIIGDDGDRVIKGSSIPRMTYGINLTAAYNGFDLYVLGQGVSGIDAYYGGDAFNTFDLHQDYVINKRVLNRWTPDNKSTKYPRLTSKLNNNVLPSDYWLQSAKYFRIKTIQLGYTVPQNISAKIFVNRLRVYTALENFFTITGYEGFDPENVGVVYPTMKQWTLGLNVTF